MDLGRADRAIWVRSFSSFPVCASHLPPGTSSGPLGLSKVLERDFWALTCYNHSIIPEGTDHTYLCERLWPGAPKFPPCVLFVLCYHMLFGKKWDHRAITIVGDFFQSHWRGGTVTFRRGCGWQFVPLVNVLIK